MNTSTEKSQPGGSGNVPRPEHEAASPLADDSVSHDETQSPFENPTDDSFGESNPFAGGQARSVDAVLEAAEDDRPLTRDEELERMRQEVEQVHQRVLMAQAESENFRKRTRKDYEDRLRFASLPLIEDLLQVRDNLHRAIEAAGEAGQAAEGIVAGIRMVAQSLDDVMGKHHVKPIPALGQPFDPNFHQAIAQSPSNEYAEGHVAIEATPGFQLHGRVVRPSQVVVSSGKAPS